MSSPFAPIQPSKANKANLNVIQSPAFTLDSKETTKTKGGSFADLFGGFLKNADDSLWASGENTKKLVTGQLNTAHEMTIAGAKAEIMLKLTGQICSKLSSATTTLFQMQI